MEKSSYFIEEKALFGSFPTQDAVTELEKEGVRIFVDLTEKDESKTIPYVTEYEYIKFPIADHHVPDDLQSFSHFIVTLCIKIRNLVSDEKIREKMYIHCKGGHGRAGIVVACVLCYYFNIHPKDALKLTSKSHAARPKMRDKWRYIGSPQNSYQKEFVFNFFKTLKYGYSLSNKQTLGFNNDDKYSVEIDVGDKTYVFPTASIAFYAMYKEYPEDWDEHKKTYMYAVLDKKFRQHPSLKSRLLETGLRPLVKISKDTYWGCGRSAHSHSHTGSSHDSRGLNTHGKLLELLRETFLIESRN